MRESWFSLRRGTDVSSFSNFFFVTQNNQNRGGGSPWACPLDPPLEPLRWRWYKISGVIQRNNFKEDNPLFGLSGALKCRVSIVFITTVNPEISARAVMFHFWRKAGAEGQGTLIESRRFIKGDYYSFKIFSRFWLVKTTRIIHHSQLLFTKFGKHLRHIESMTSKVERTENYWTSDVKMTSKVQPAADYWIVDRENLGTRLCYIWWAEKLRA